MIWNNISPTNEDIRQWAHDDNLLFTEQDEDLILYSTSYLPILVELACTSDCSKSDYCLSILSNYSKELLCSRNLVSIQKIINSINESRINPTVEFLTWRKQFDFCKSLLDNPRKIDLNECDNLAHFLLSGDVDLANVKKLGEIRPDVIEYAKSGTYQDYLYIDLSTGSWQFSKLRRLVDA